MNKKFLSIVLFLSLFVFIINTVEASNPYLGTVRVGSCISLKQICSSCTYNNVTSVVAPDATQLLSNSPMTKIGSEYNRTFCQTTQVGEYTVSGVGDIDGTEEGWIYNFSVTPSGYINILGLFIIVIGVIYGIAFFGFFGKNEWIAVLGGMAMIVLGLFTLNNGIDVYRNFMTQAFSFITIGLGAIFALTAGVEIINDNM